MLTSQIPLITSRGTLVYGNTWAFLSIKDDIVAYYQWFLKRRFHGGLKLHLPKVGAHVTMIRGEDDDPISAEIHQQLWGKYQGQEFDTFINTHHLWFNGETFWFNTRNPALEKIRVELGLPPTPTLNYHLTIGKLYPEDVEKFHTYLGLEVEIQGRVSDIYQIC